MLTHRLKVKSGNNLGREKNQNILQPGCFMIVIPHFEFTI